MVEAGTAARALALLEQHPDIRLLFTDIGLPGGVSGVQLANEVRQLYPDLKVLLTTGYAPQSLANPLDADFPLLVKPYRYASLAAKVDAVLDSAPLLRAVLSAPAPSNFPG